MTDSTASYEVVRETWLTRKPDPSAGFIAGMTTVLLAVGSILFLYDIAGLGSLMGASGQAVFDQMQLWRLWTTLFAHGDLGHFAANSLLFFTLGYFLNGYFGTRVFPIAAFAFGGITNLAVLTTYDPAIQLIGASGIVYWMGGAWLVLYFFLSRQKNLTQRWLRSLGVAILIFMPAETFEAHVSYRTHFVGFAFGALFGAVYFWLNRRRFRAAEVRETIFEETDPGDDLPGPEGLGQNQ